LGFSSFSITRLLLNLWLMYLVFFGNHKDFFIKNFIYGIIILNLFSFSPFLARISQYLLLVQILIIPNLELPYAPKYKKITQLTGILYAIIVFVFLFIHNVGEIYPYKICF
jgi:hypothetical protein